MGKTAKEIIRGKLYLRTQKNIDPEKRYPIYIYYFCKGKQLRQKTDIFSKVKDWDPKANDGIGGVKASYGKNYEKENKRLQNKLQKLDNAIFEFIEKGRIITPEVIKKLMNGDTKPLRADEGVRFTDYALDLLKNQYENHKIKISTYTNSVTIIKNFDKYMNEKELIKNNSSLVGNITEDAIREFIYGKYNEGLKNSTVKKKLEVIQKICKHASNEGLLESKPAEAIKSIRLESSLDDDAELDIKYLTTEDLSKLVHCNEDIITKKQKDYLRIFFWDFYSCGLRISDVMTLRWKDINFDKREINKIQMKPRRGVCIPLRNEAIDILKYWQHRNETFVFDLLPSNFDLRDEKELKRRRNSITATINKSLSKIAKKVQLNKKVTFHMARHSFAVSALEQGMPIKRISELLGHKDTSTTSNIYARYMPSSNAQAVESLIYNF